ncbi:MAG: amidohydrolase [Asgard group archaeon]|nr:amidohydrolase [Asgard group archaeon]
MTNLEVDISIINGYILTMNNNMDTIKQGYILIKDSKIIDLGTMIEFQKQYGTMLDTKEEIDAKGCLILPGFINSHGHFAMALFRGISDDIPLMKWLNDYIWPIEAQLTSDDCYIGTQLAALEMIQGGTTAACDMYFYEERTIDALEKIGFRGILGYGMLDFGNADKIKSELEKTIELINYANDKAKICSIIISPHAPNTCSEELLKESLKISEKFNLPLQIHLSETKDEVAIIKEKYNCTPTEFLEKSGILCDKLIAAHCVWLTEKDCQILNKWNVKIANNPTSNLKLGSGIMDYEMIKSNDLIISIGTDGASSNNKLSMIEELRLASYIHKGNKLNPEILPASDALRLATINGAKALSQDDVIGSIEKGKLADITILDTKHLRTWPPHNPYSLIAYSASDLNVKTTIINGRIVMKNRDFTTIDIDSVMQESKERIYQIMDRAKLGQYKDKLQYLQ